MSNPLPLGVDVHRQTNTVCLMDLAGHVLGRRHTIDNNRPGAALLVDHLAQQMAQGDFDTIQIAAEATGWYCWHFKKPSRAIRLCSSGRSSSTHSTRA
jgi:hypothetical protein